MDPGKILSPSDCDIARTPQELLEWVEEKKNQFAHSKKARSFLKSREGLAKKFLDAVYPLSLLAMHLFQGRVDVVCRPDLDAEDFDAIIIDYRDRPPIHKIVFTQAIYRYEEYLRRVYLPDVSVRSRKRRPSKGESDGAANNILWRIQALELIAEAARREVGHPHGKDTSLVIVFDDYAAFQSEDDLSSLEAFVDTEILPLDLDFAKLFLLGWSGRTLLAFSLSGSETKAIRR